MAVMTYREAVRQTLDEEMTRDERIFLIGEDIGAFGGSYSITNGFLEKYGRKRVIDAPLAESIIVGMSIGAAMAGLRPVPELMTINPAAGDGSDRQSCRQAAPHVQWPDSSADDDPHRDGHRPTPAPIPSSWAIFGHFPACRRAGDTGRRARHAQDLSAWDGPGDVHRACQHL
jgi:hypothetical protein